MQHSKPAPFQKLSIEEGEKQLVTKYIDLAASSVGSKVIECSDEWFAPATNLIKPYAPVRKPGEFTDRGAWMDGWESRRHNPNHDWVIIRLGSPGHVVGFDIDTAHFTGNQAPAATVEACYSTGDPNHSDDAQWTEILPLVALSPDSRHLFSIPRTEQHYTHIRLNIHPDGGVARFRVYGTVRAVWPSDPTARVDLAFVGNEGKAVACSDQHYGVMSNLLLPGRGKDMGDGWETKRSREPNHCDWVVVRLGAVGFLEETLIDTAHFKGNFPESAMLEACMSLQTVPDDIEWTIILPRSKLGPHKQSFFQLTRNDIKFSHVRLTIYPDGGIKRLRIIGRRASEQTHDAAVPRGPFTGVDQTRETRHVVAGPLTHSAFAPYGQVIQSWSDPRLSSSACITRGIRVMSANEGTAKKYCNIASVVNFRQSTSFLNGRLVERAEPNLSLYRCDPVKHLPFTVKLLERHPYSTQAFIPLMSEGANGYLLVVALNGPDGKPDLNTLRAFVASRSQGISYNVGTWHHPMIALEQTTDFACLVHESGILEDDCNVVPVENINVVVDVPELCSETNAPSTHRVRRELLTS